MDTLTLEGTLGSVDLIDFEEATLGKDSQQTTLDTDWLHSTGEATQDKYLTLNPKFQRMTALRAADSGLFYAGFRVFSVSKTVPLTGHAANSR